MGNLFGNRIVGMAPFGTFLVLMLLAFIYCYYGSRVTAKPIHFAKAVYEIPWYLLPMRRQNDIKMMIQYGKYEISYSGYGIIICSLETFRQVSQNEIKVALKYIINHIFFSRS